MFKLIVLLLVYWKLTVSFEIDFNDGWFKPMTQGSKTQFTISSKGSEYRDSLAKKLYDSIGTIITLDNDYKGTPDYKYFTNINFFGSANLLAEFSLDYSTTIISLANVTEFMFDKLDIPSIKNDNYKYFELFYNNTEGCEKYPGQCQLIKSSIKFDQEPNYIYDSPIIFTRPTLNQQKLSSGNGSLTLSNKIGIESSSQSTLKGINENEKDIKEDVLSPNNFPNLLKTFCQEYSLSDAKNLQNEIGIDYSNFKSVIGLNDLLIDPNDKQRIPVGFKDFAKILIFSDKNYGLRRQYLSSKRFKNSQNNKLSAIIAISDFPASKFQKNRKFTLVPTVPLNSEGQRTEMTSEGKFIMVRNWKTSKNFFFDSDLHLVKLDISTTSLKVPEKHFRNKEFTKLLKINDCATNKRLVVQLTHDDKIVIKLNNLMYRDPKNTGKCFINMVATNDKFFTFGTDVLAFMNLAFYDHGVYISQNQFIDYNPLLDVKN